MVREQRGGGGGRGSPNLSSRDSSNSSGSRYTTRSQENSGENSGKATLETLQASILELTRAHQRDSKIINQLLTKITGIEHQVQEKDKKIKELESRIDDLEQYSRKDDLIITGMKVERSYARVAEGEAGVETDLNGFNTVEDQVITKLNEHGLELKEEEISACHPIGKRNDNGETKVIMRFVSRKTKDRLLRNGRKLKNTGIYLNEHLTSKNGGIAKAARDLRKQNKIDSTWTRNCKVFVKMLDGTVLPPIKDKEELSKL